MTATDDSISIRELLEASLKSQREYLEASLRNHREYVDLAVKRVSDGVVSLESRMGDASNQHNLSHAREHTLVADAVDKAERAMTAQLAAVKSEFEQYKATQKDERNRFEETLGRQLVDINLSMKSLAEWRSNMQGKVAAFGGIVAVLTVISMLLAIWASLK